MVIPKDSKGKPNVQLQSYLPLDGSRTVLISYGHLSGRAAVFEPGGDLQEDDI